MHLADNDKLAKNDKFAKVRPYLNLMQRNFAQFGVFSKCLSVDEQMAPYFGHFSAKMYMKNNPVKFGMKIWFLASSQGYPFAFQVYTGKSDSKEGPLEEQVVNELTEVLEENSNHILSFDNFFSSTILCRDLAEKSLRYTGTVRQNRTESCPFSNPSTMKKRERGAFEVISDGKVTLCQWNDNRPVCVVSNHKGVDPTVPVRRWSSATRNAVSIAQPRMIQSCNKHMGGVDLLDRFLSDYRPRLRSKKWWWCLFANFLSMSVVAAWRLHKELKGKMSHLQFRREIV